MKGNGFRRTRIALPFRGDAFRVVYAVQLGADVWVIHVFKKKSKKGVKTPKQEIDLIESRMKQVKELLRETEKHNRGDPRKR